MGQIARERGMSLLSKEKPKEISAELCLAVFIFLLSYFCSPHLFAQREHSNRTSKTSDKSEDTVKVNVYGEVSGEVVPRGGELADVNKGDEDIPKDMIGTTQQLAYPVNWDAIGDKPPTPPPQPSVPTAASSGAPSEKRSIVSPAENTVPQQGAETPNVSDESLETVIGMNINSPDMDVYDGGPRLDPVRRLEGRDLDSVRLGIGFTGVLADLEGLGLTIPLSQVDLKRQSKRIGKALDGFLKEGIKNPFQSSERLEFDGLLGKWSRQSPGSDTSLGDLFQGSNLGGASSSGGGGSSSTCG